MFIHSFDDIPENAKICIFGKGSYSEDFVKFLKIYPKNIEIVCRFDSSDLDEFIKTGYEYDFIVIASIAWQEIKIILDKKNIFKYKILPAEFVWFVHDYFLRLNSIEKYEPVLPEILEMFEDDSSKNLYRNLFNCHLGNEVIGVIEKKSLENANYLLKNHYLEFLVKDKIETFVDAGSYDGATLDKFFKELKNLKNLFCFEPLKDKLLLNYSDFLDISKYPIFEVIPKGLWSESKKIGFNLDFFGSAIVDSEVCQDTIETISLDEFVSENDVPKIDFIKMDIENAELDALKGGILRIKKDRPQLVISIYHSLEQFVEVPLFLKNNLENYSYYLGHYTCSMCDTVLYAIPKELEF